MPDNPETPTMAEPNVAEPGPHPHESEDVKYWRGDSMEVPTEPGPEPEPEPEPEGDLSAEKLAQRLA